MPEPEKIKLAIQTVIQGLMDRVMNTVLVRDPFIVETHRAAKPLYAALVPDEIFMGAHFERRFVTPFGGTWEKLALVAAREGFGHAETQYMVNGQVRAERLRRIQEVLDRLEHGSDGAGTRVRPDWDSELGYIIEGGGELIPVSVNCDLLASTADQAKKVVFELKAPLPNSDQTKVSKEKLLKLSAMEPPMVDAAYYALPYNPYGKKELYTWSFPARWFNMQKDRVVLIGDEFWNMIGGEGTYKALIDAVNELGSGYRDRIYREYLGIEPPPPEKSQPLIIKEERKPYT
jgi:hypothetical protein